MQVYAIRICNFFRFSEKDNSVVLDISPEDQVLLANGKTTIDKIYDKIIENPIEHVKKVKERGLTNLVGIAGMMGDNYDFSNGSGKSTILEAICYAHYEQVVRRNANTDKVATAGLSVVTKINGKYPPKMRESWVEEIFEEDGKIYRIKRGRTFTSTQNSSSPLLEFVCYNEGVDGEDSQAGHRKADTNESIAKVTSMDYDLFVNSVLFGQSDAGKFLTGTDKTRKEMLISLLRLEGVVNGCLDNVRKRKNAKDKDIASLTAQIDIVDNNLKAKSSIESIEGQIVIAQDNIKKTEVEIKNSNDKIENLSKSDIIKKLEGIKEEGKKIKESLLSKKEAKESQIKEWNNLYNDADKKEKSQLDKIESLVKKRKEIDEQIINLDNAIKSFDLATREEELKKVEKAKEVKPKIVEAVKKLQDDKEKLVAQVSSEEFEYNRLNKDENNRFIKEITPLKVQIANVKDEFICDKCKSKVSKSHIEKEIKEIEDKIKNNNEACKKILANIEVINKSKQEVIEKLNKFQTNLEKVNDYLIKENKIKSEIKDNDNKKQKLEETKKLQSEDYGKMYSDLQEECLSLKKQKEEYAVKKNEIAEKYDLDIQKTQKELDDMATKLLSAKKDAENIENSIKSLKDSIANWTKNKSQYDSQVGSFKKDIETIQKDILVLKQLQDKCVQENALLNRLIMLDDIFGLEGIQTRIIKKYLPLLNNYIKEILDIISNGEMRIKVYINDKSKVDISIEGGTSDTFIQLSGGEKTLCRLGVSIGLALLSFTRCAHKPELICLDEIFSALDVAHEEAVFKLLKKLETKFSRILIISHRTSINDRIEHKILVEKEQGVYGMSKIKSIT